MSKLTKALIPSYNGHSLAPGVSRNGMPAGIQKDGMPTVAGALGVAGTPMEGTVPGKWGIPEGTPDGMRQAMSPDSNYLPHGVNVATDASPLPANPTTHSAWGDPDLSKRGWGWGMDANGKLQTGVMGGGPAGSPWGPQGAAGPVPQATGQAQTNLGQLGHSMAGGMQGLAGGAGGLTGFAHSLAQGMRQFNAAGGLGAQGQQGPSTAVGGPQGQYGMGGQPGAPAGAFTAPQQFPPQMPPQMPPQVPGSPAYGQNQQGTGIQALIDQLRQQQPQQSSL